MKGLRFADTMDWCFETWKSSHMGCEALLCGRLADVQELRLKSDNCSDMGCAELLIVTNGIFWLRNVQIRAVPFCKGVVLLMIRNSVFRVRNFEI